MHGIGTRPLQHLTHNSSSPLLTGVRMYIYALPFTYALSIADSRLTISLLLSGWLVTLLTFRLIRHAVAIPRLKTVFLLFLAFLFFLPLGQLLTATVSSKSLNHLLAYGISIVGFGFIPMLAVANISVPGWAEVLVRDIMWTARIAALAAVLQFISSNFFGVFFEDFIYYPDTIEARSMFLGLFYRSRGFAAEPGHYAFTLELLAPLLLYGHSVRQEKSSLVIIADFLLMLLAFLSIGSPAGLLIFGAGFLLAALLFPSRNVAPLLWLGLISLAITLSLVNIVGNQVNQSNWLDLLSSLFFDKLDSTSATDRAERIDIGLKLIGEASPLQLLLGYGPAMHESQKLGEQTIIQFYLLLFLEGGVLGMLLFLGGFACMVAHAIKRLGPGRVFYFWALLSLALHYFFISNYYYPMIWFMFPLLLIMEAVHEKR
jgi:hypothetical protein